jgi:hypothetical protein
MRDYMFLSDADLVLLHDELSGESDCTSDSGAECSPLEQELSRRANDLCTSLDSKTAVCCRLDNWSLRVSGNTEKLGAPVLAGCVYRHCELLDGTPIVTSPLQMIVRTADHDLAITGNDIYELSKLDEDYVSELLDGSLL